MYQGSAAEAPLEVWGYGILHLDKNIIFRLVGLKSRMSRRPFTRADPPRLIVADKTAGQIVA